MAGAREILFRIFYSTSFTIFFLLLIVFIAITPADKFYQSYRRNRLIDIFIETGAYLLTAFIAAFLYASRLFTNRSVLRDIPKTYLPIEKEDLPGKRVHRLIEECLARSAVVAYQAKPRGRRIEVEVPRAAERMLAITRETKTHYHEHHLTEGEQHLLEPTWGTVLHPGWQSPASNDMPNLEFASVVDELIDLVEAKAVSLAPADPMATPTEDGITPTDHSVIEMLTRPDTAGMRQYLGMLMELGVVPEGNLSEEFLVSYERARFGSTPPTEDEFRVLMRMFAELLRSMKRVDLDLLQIDDDSPSSSTDHLPGPQESRPHRSKSPSSSSDRSTFSASSVRRIPSHPDRPPRRVSEDSVPSMSEDDFVGSHPFRTAPATQLHSQAMSRSGTGSGTQSQPYSQSHSQPHSQGGSSSRYFSAQQSITVRPTLTRGPSDISAASYRSDRSSRSRRSERSTAGSVIRLSEGVDGSLPYTIEIPRNLG